MLKQKKRVRILRWLTKKHQFVVRDENNFEELRSASFNNAQLLSVFFLAFVLIMLFSLFLSKTILKQWYDPEYVEHKIRKQVDLLATEIDSLEYGLQLRDQKLHMLTVMLEGGESIENPKENTHSNTDYKKLGVDELSEVEKNFRQEFEKGQIDEPDVEYTSKAAKVFETTFLSPAPVIEISKKFQPSLGHYGVDIVSALKSPIISPVEGTVLFTQWTQEDGNVVAIQHPNDLITIYKHNETILKKVGNFVKAGDVIAIMGNTGEGSSGPHLHFEMWIDGKPVNPEHYISF